MDISNQGRRCPYLYRADLMLIPTLPPSIPADVAHRAMAAVICQGKAPRHVLIADMSQPSSHKRLWVLDLTKPGHPVLIAQEFVAHGSGSDPSRSGYARKFSNTVDSGMTSLGLYRVAEPYRMAKHGKAYRLDGLSITTDGLARTRGVVLHPADYVRETGVVGRSLGCPALNPATFIRLDKGGYLAGALIWIDGGYASPTTSCAALASPWPSTPSLVYGRTVQTCSIGDLS